MGRWLDKSGFTYPLLVGMFVLIFGTLLLVTIQDDSGVAWIFAVLSVIGISYGMNNLGLQTALYSFVSTEETGIASGLLMTSRYIGTIFSSSLLGIFFSKEITTNQLHGMALLFAVIGCATFMLTLIVAKMSWRKGNTELPSRSGMGKMSG
jgi:MFS family permease